MRRKQQAKQRLNNLTGMFDLCMALGAGKESHATANRSTIPQTKRSMKEVHRQSASNTPIVLNSYLYFEKRAECMKRALLESTLCALHCAQLLPTPRCASRVLEVLLPGTNPK